MHSALVLCFHSGNPQDYLVLPEVLARARARRIPIVPLLQLAIALREARTHELPEKFCCLSFDDGQDMDFVDVTHPTHGAQPSFARIMREAEAANSGVPIHATSFVIASPLTRAQIQEKEMLSYPWMSDRWWNPAVASGRFHIASHSYDHLSVSADPVKQREGVRGDFSSIDYYEDANWQIRKARELIEFICPNPGVVAGNALFAYPYGHTSRYLLEEYWPNFAHEHGTIGAFTCEPALVTPSTSCFEIPRMVLGMDWQTPDELPILGR